MNSKSFNYKSLLQNIILMRKFFEINFFVYSNKNDEKFLKVTSNEFDLDISIKSDID